MSKYEEAKEKPLFGFIKNSKTYIEIDDEWLNVVDEALDIAHKVEQLPPIIALGLIVNEDKYNDNVRANYYYSGFSDGYAQAAKDIRGDNNE